MHSTSLVIALVLASCAATCAYTTTTWTNFLGIFSCGDAVVIKPSSVGEIQALLTSGDFSKVKAVGTGLSYNGWTCPAAVPEHGPGSNKPRLIIDMQGLNTIYGIDAASKTVLVDAGVRVGDLCRYLFDQGYALKTFSRQVNVTAAGALSTATHGSNTKDGAFSSTVVGVEIVFANGTKAYIDGSTKTKRARYLLPALRASFGRLGVITKVRISLVVDVPVRRELTSIPISTFIDKYTGSQAACTIAKLDNEEQNFFFMPNLDDSSFVLGRSYIDNSDQARAEVQTYQAFYSQQRATQLPSYIPPDLQAVMLDPTQLQQTRLYDRPQIAKIWYQFLKEAAIDPPVTLKSIGFAAYFQATAATRAVLPLRPGPGFWKLDIYEVAVQMEHARTCISAVVDLVNSAQKYKDSLYAFMHIRFLKNAQPILLSPTLGKLAMYVDIDVYWYDGPEGVQYYLEWNRILDVMTGPQCNGVLHWGLNGPWKLYSHNAKKLLGKQLKEFKAIADEVDPRGLFETELDQYFFSERD